MIVEIYFIISVLIIAFALLKEKDPMYVLFVFFGILATLFVEPSGVEVGRWAWKNITPPLDFLVLGVPIAIYVIYIASTVLSSVLTNKWFTPETKPTDNNKKIGKLSILVGTIVLLMSSIYTIHAFIPMVFFMVGTYLLVNNTVVLKVGLFGLVFDFITESAFSINNQLVYYITDVGSIEDVPVGFFLGFSILSALTIMIKKRN
jgi:hypothetical protein